MVLPLKPSRVKNLIYGFAMQADAERLAYAKAGAR